MVAYRWRCAVEDSRIGREVGALPIGANYEQIVTRIFSAYMIVDAQG
jgi:hypothetical protein